MNTIYKKTQFGILGIIMFVSMLIMSIVYFYGSSSNFLVPYLILMFVFVVTILLFYKLTISIDEEKITAIFGIGFLKKTILLNEIDSIENYEIPWYAGIGVRLTPKGWLWNVSTGNAVLIQNKTKTITFLVGSNEVDEVINILKQKI